MKTGSLFLAPVVLAAAPAHATGELVCETASGEATRISLGFGHAPVATGMWASAQTGDTAWQKVEVAHSWMDREKLLVDLTDTERTTLLARIEGRWNDETNSFDGTLTQGETTRWVRCRG